MYMYKIITHNLFFHPNCVSLLRSIFFPAQWTSENRDVTQHTIVYNYLCRLAWVDQKRRQVLYQRYIRATQVLYQLPIKTSGENRQMKQLGIFAAVTIE